MANHTDQELARALIHEVNVMWTSSGQNSEEDTKRMRDMTHLAEIILAGNADDADRNRVYETVHPSTVSHYLP